MNVIVPATGKRTRQRTSHGHFINATFRDIELFRYLIVLGISKPPNVEGRPGLKLWSQPRTDLTHMELVYYFRDAAHRSLATFSPTTTPMRDVILHMIFSRNTVSRRALFHALLAFSSLHRSGLHRATMLFKVAALEALSASAKEAAQGPVEAAQHVAACMMLCAFEILLPSENSGEWLWHIRGAMEIIQHVQLGTQSNSVGTSNLIDWVYYHDSLSRFTLYHWRHKSLAAEPTALTAAAPNRAFQITAYPPPLLAGERPPLPLLSPTHRILNVLSEICSVLLDPSDPRSHDASYKERLQALEWKVDSLPWTPTSTSTTPSPSPPSSSDYDDDETPDCTIDLYKAATRIYLTRATQDPSVAPADLSPLISRAFEGPLRSCYCRHFFPLLIVACEARAEDQRAAILNLIARTEGKGYVRSMAAFRAQVCAFWTQRDLCEEAELVPDYLGLMRAVVSSDRALPSYV